jgi:hypothetical protein
MILKPSEQSFKYKMLNKLRNLLRKLREHIDIEILHEGSKLRDKVYKNSRLHKKASSIVTKGEINGN